MEDIDDKTIIRSIVNHATPFNRGIITLKGIDYRFDPELKKAAKTLNWLIMGEMLVYLVIFNLVAGWLKTSIDMDFIWVFILVVAFLAIFSLTSQLLADSFLLRRIQRPLADHLIALNQDKDKGS